MLSLQEPEAENRAMERRTTYLVLGEVDTGQLLQPMDLSFEVVFSVLGLNE